MTMKMAQLPSRLRVVFALLATTVLFACAASTASAFVVNLRIEGDTETIYNGPVVAQEAIVKTTNNTGCQDDASPDAHLTKVTPTSIIGNWASSSGTVYNTQNAGNYLCRVGSLISDAYNPDYTVLQKFWMMKINEKTKTPEGGYLTGGTKLSEGDSVLWYWTNNFDYGQPTLAVDVPSIVQIGTTASATIYKYDSNDDSRSAAAGASVVLDGVTYTAGAGGKVSLPFSTLGAHLITTTLSGSIRASKLVTVTATPPPPPVKSTAQINQEKRVAARAKCRKVYKSKKGPRYKKCLKKANAIGKKKSSK
jgi:hypothetical protein